GVLRVTFMDEAIYLHTLQIRSEFRRRGFGRQLLENIVRDLLAEGKRVRLEVDTENDIALSLYRSCGFQVIATYRYYELRA
ncbi:MAG: GNAT family N-acetyltransferase, partial [Anaerolineae bacterium]|nr:GNAT family N-acetyltransferase [Anaerolineae bacterium]